MLEYHSTSHYRFLTMLQAKIYFFPIASHNKNTFHCMFDVNAGKEGGSPKGKNIHRHDFSRRVEERKEIGKHLLKAVLSPWPNEFYVR